MRRHKKKAKRITKKKEKNKLKKIKYCSKIQNILNQKENYYEIHKFKDKS